MSADNASGLAAPSGLNHLVLNVRNMDESHRFWTEVVGLKQVGKVQASSGPAEPAQHAVLQRRSWRRQG